MKEAVFSNGSNHDNRKIMIRINDDIEFFFYDQYLRQKQWIEEETERRLQCGEDELTEDEESNNSFYYILKQDWISDKTERLDREDNFHTHMMRKTWFTKEMKDFIDKSTN